VISSRVIEKRWSSRGWSTKNYRSKWWST